MREIKQDVLLLRKTKDTFQDEGDVIIRMVIIGQDDSLDTLRMREIKQDVLLLRKTKGQTTGSS